jgi:hypothetical protein
MKKLGKWGRVEVGRGVNEGKSRRDGEEDVDGDGGRRR